MAVKEKPARIIRSENVRTKKLFASNVQNTPCRRLKALDRRYRAKYHMSMLENLAYIQENGLDEFIRQQEERYRCSRCGKLRTVHQDYCLYCAEMNKEHR